MTSRETKTHCVGSYLSDKGSIKNPILVPNELRTHIRGGRQFSMFMSENICAMVDFFEKAVAEEAR